MATNKAALCSSPPATWGQTLCLRRTFIDVLEVSEQDASPRGRACSEPGPDWMPGGSFFQEDVDYMDALQVKMEDPISALYLPLPPPAEFLKDVAGSMVDLTAREERDLNENNAARGTCFPSSPLGGVSTNAACSTLASTVLVEPADFDETRHTCCPPPPLGGPLKSFACSTPASTVHAEQEDLDKDAPPFFNVPVTSAASTSMMLPSGAGEEVQPLPESCWPPSTPACNLGSVGHPMFCSRPCRFFLEGRCKSSADCGFCHLAHPKSGSSLDKRNRGLLKSMSEKNRGVLLAAVMKSKVSPFTEMTELIDDWAREVSGASAATELEEALNQAVAPGIKRPDLRRLLACLQSMSLANLSSLSRLYLDAARDINEGGHLLEVLRKVLV